MLYRIASDDTTTAIPKISGRNIAHVHRTVAERALLGADLHLDHVELISPTIKQCAILVGVCTQYVAAAVIIADDPAVRAAVLAGERSILGAAKPSETLADHFVRTSPADWLEVARTIGPAVIWDTMISPLV